MTEDEAKGKWCPFVRVINGAIGPGPNAPTSFNPAQVAYNRATDGNSRWSFPAGGASCIGSACMAWRVGRGPQNEPLGFCGLAGPIGVAAFVAMPE